MPLPEGSAATSFVQASRPPAEAPMPTTAKSPVLGGGLRVVRGRRLDCRRVVSVCCGWPRGTRQLSLSFASYAEAQRELSNLLTVTIPHSKRAGWPRWSGVETEYRERWLANKSRAHTGETVCAQRHAVSSACQGQVRAAKILRIEAVPVVSESTQIAGCDRDNPAAAPPDYISIAQMMPPPTGVRVWLATGRRVCGAV